MRKRKKGELPTLIYDGGMDWLIWIPFIPPSSNDLKRMHFLSVATSRKTIHRAMEPIIWNIQSAPDYQGPSQMVRIEAVFHWTDQRRRDIGNFAESLKAILDSLNGVCFPDDDMTHVREIILRGKAKAGQKGILLRIAPIVEVGGDRDRQPGTRSSS